MRKLSLLILFSFLMLWPLAGCRVTAERESASIPPEQSDGPGDVSAEPTPSEVVSSTPEPTEEAPATSAPVENSPELPPTFEIISGVTLIYQNPELPNGCEITSLAILLDWAGYPIDKVELSDTYLPKQGFYRTDEGVLHGADPNQAYAGDPSSSSSGWYCFEGPILKAANAYLSDQNTTQQAAPLSGATREELENYMNAGIPLAVWVTLDYSAPRRSASSWILPDGTDYVPYNNLHCVVLAGWEGENYRIANPIDGWQTVSPDKFWECFDAMGRRAVAILPN